MIHLQHGEHQEGNLTVPIYNFHLLTLKLGYPLATDGFTRVVCSRCGLEAAVSERQRTVAEILLTEFHLPCPKRDEP